MVAATMKHMAEGVDFRRWQKKMHILLSSISVVYVLTTPIPEDGGDDATMKQSRKRAKRHFTLVEFWAAVCILRSSIRDAGYLTSQKKTMLPGPLVMSIWVEQTTPPVTLKDIPKVLNYGNKANGSSIKGSDDDVAWWVDSGATVHTCKDRCSFKTYESLNDRSIHHIGNELIALVHGRGWLNIVNDNIASAFMSTSKLNDSILWHARLGHVQFKRMQDMSKDGDEIFDENRFSSVPRSSLRIPNGTEDVGGSVVPEEGFKQKSGIDYFDTYAPVARISTIRLLIAMASIHSLIIHQMDVKTTFLNGELKEGVYMNQPMGFIMPSNKNKLTKIVYSKFDESDKGVIICLYVDDMLIFGTDQVQVDLAKEFLSSRSTYLVNRSPSLAIGFKKPIDMLGFF
ncbi:zinc finger, CCHC-type containing protein, partial [Tanacetum coccineum]